MNKARHALFIVLFLVMGCCAAQAQSAAEMQQLASDLMQLTPAVESAVRYDYSTGNMTDGVLLHYATRKNPEKLTPFNGYALYVERENGHAAVLVCTKDEPRALLEDAGCTMMFMERHHWRDNPGSPCAFTLDLDAICPK
jgi:hypothetical protein